MTKTHGRTPKPIPEFVLNGLANLGYRKMDYTLFGVPVFRHPSFADLRAMVIVPNLPGSTELVVEWTGQPPTLMSPESFLRHLEDQLGERRLGVRMRQGSSD